MNNFLQVCQNCVFRAQENESSKANSCENFGFLRILRKLAKHILQVFEKHFLLAQIMYLTRMFLIYLKNQYFHNLPTQSVQKIFGIWHESFNMVAKTAFFFWRRKFWWKVFSEGSFFVQVISNLRPIQVSSFVRNVFYVFKCMEKFVTIAIIVSKEVFCGKASVGKTFQIWLPLDFCWVIFGKSVKTAFYVRRETFWEKPFLAKFVGSYINFEIWKVIFSAVSEIPSTSPDNMFEKTVSGWKTNIFTL